MCVCCIICIYIYHTDSVNGYCLNVCLWGGWNVTGRMIISIMIITMIAIIVFMVA